jgi:hypothetical protein
VAACANDFVHDPAFPPAPLQRVVSARDGDGHGATDTFVGAAFAALGPVGEPERLLAELPVTAATGTGQFFDHVSRDERIGYQSEPSAE